MTDEKRNEPVIRAEIRTSAPPELAWEAWADPARLAQWFVDDARGEANAGETMTWVWAEFGLEVPYRVLAADAPKRLVLATPEQVAPPGVIEITIASEGGETVITVVNSGFQTEGTLDDEALTFEGGTPWDEVFSGVRSGWQMTLALLKEYLEHYARQPKRTFIVLKPAQLDARDALAWFTDEQHLARWLTRAGAPGDVGEPSTLELKDGTVIEGRTIARTDLELSVAWPAEDAVLELKTFPLGDARMVALRCTCWNPDDVRFGRLRAQCSEALLRLVSAVSGQNAHQVTG